MSDEHSVADCHDPQCESCKQWYADERADQAGHDAIEQAD